MVGMPRAALDTAARRRSNREAETGAKRSRMCRRTGRRRDGRRGRDSRSRRRDSGEEALATTWQSWAAKALSLTPRNPCSARRRLRSPRAQCDCEGRRGRACLGWLDEASAPADPLGGCTSAPTTIIFELRQKLTYDMPHAFRWRSPPALAPSGPPAARLWWYASCRRARGPAKKRMLCRARVSGPGFFRLQREE